VTNVEGAELCPVCRRGHFTRRIETIAFLQGTDRGPVRCEVTILVAVCDHCEYMTWGSEAEAVIEQAVRRAYDALG